MDMPMKKKRTAAAQAAARGRLPEVPAELLDHLVKGPMTPSEVQDLFPRTTVQTCIVHLIRNSLDYACWKDRKAVAAEQGLQTFADGPWGIKYPTIVAAWQRAWENVTPFVVFPPDIRRVIYTTDENDKPQRDFFMKSVSPAITVGRRAPWGAPPSILRTAVDRYVQPAQRRPVLQADCHRGVYAGDGQQTAQSFVTDTDLRQGPVHLSQIFTKAVQFPQALLDAQALIHWQRLRAEPHPSLLAKQVRSRTPRDQMHSQHRMDSVLEPRALPNELCPARDLSA
jgi:hypothetical protein